mmetsp:Transcript_9520/g.23307  ORF Transcript_9520/g.23307 Transcript_9520/m.23307 type:complete len:84 (-) Transcript_9520:1022-1273(-)
MDVWPASCKKESTDGWMDLDGCRHGIAHTHTQAGRQAHWSTDGWMGSLIDKMVGTNALTQASKRDTQPPPTHLHNTHTHTHIG